LFYGGRKNGDTPTPPQKEKKKKPRFEPASLIKGSPIINLAAKLPKLTSRKKVILNEMK